MNDEKVFALMGGWNAQAETDHTTESLQTNRLRSASKPGGQRTGYIKGLTRKRLMAVAEIKALEIFQDRSQGTDVREIGRLFTLHCIDQHLVQQREEPGVILHISLDSLGHKILADDFLKGVGVILFIHNPPDELIVVARIILL